jgi:acetoin utilization deacetylase AcuC-like enzyme
VTHLIQPSRPALATVISYDAFHKRHTLEGHPENHRRVEESWSLLQIDGILHRVQQLPTTPAPYDALLRVHSRAYLDRLENTVLLGGGRLDSDTYLTPDSFHAALLSAGGLLDVVDAVMRGKARNGMALGRPPGHHAMPHWGMGFCLLANAAIAARWAQDRHGAERVLIVDIDVHHGNGTQDVFYQDPSVLFFSVHEFPHYPGTGAATETGEGRGQGSTLNVPLPPDVGDAGYLEVVQQLLVPAARRFRPDLILVSAGYDGHWLDPLADMKLSVTGYTQLLGELMGLADELCGGRLAVTLEGGYHIGALSHSILSALRLLSNSPQGPSDPFGPAPGPVREIHALLDKVHRLHHLPDRPAYSLGG